MSFNRSFNNVCVPSSLALRKPPSLSAELGRSLLVGDVVFIRSAALPFRKVAEATNSWANHVGIVIDIAGEEPMLGESTFPFSKMTPLSRFVGRSVGQRVAVRRLASPLTAVQCEKVRQAAERRFRIFYDTGFDRYSRRQFCSRFVHEVLYEATAVRVGKVEDFNTLLRRNPHVDLVFWRFWYFGKIPWTRQTITPASLLESPQMRPLLSMSGTGLFNEY